MDDAMRALRDAREYAHNYNMPPAAADSPPAGRAPSRSADRYAGGQQQQQQQGGDHGGAGAYG